MSDEGQRIYVDRSGKVLKSADEATSGAVQLTGKDAEDYLATGKSSYVFINPDDTKGADRTDKADADKAEADKAEDDRVARTTKAVSAPANKARRASSNK